MVVRKGCADGNIDLEPAAWRVEEEFWRIERVVFVEFEVTMIKSALVGTFQIIEAEMKI